MPLLVDTGILYALADRTDAWHSRVVTMVRATREPLLAPATILPEVTYLLASRLGTHAERAFVQSIVDGEIAVEAPRSADYERALEVLGQYRDVGFVDATVVAVAERLKLRAFATTDRRHFSQIQPALGRAFTLLPAR